MSLSRRQFLTSAGIGVAVIGSAEAFFSAPNALGAPPGTPGYGPLVADPAGRLALPKGFTYQIVAEAGKTTLESGQVTPSKFDGTGAFKIAGRPSTGSGAAIGGTALVLNHEIGSQFASEKLPVPHLDGLVYDKGAAGGCTVVEVDDNGKRVKEFVGVAGTMTNCAGGITPWDTWLTCEETEQKADAAKGFEKDHGWVFEVDPFDRNANQNPKPIKAFGRYAHEACAVDPHTDAVYLTEDASKPNGLMYKWAPPAGFKGGKGAYRALADDAGVLYALVAKDNSGKIIADVAAATSVGTTYKTDWVAVPDRFAKTTPIRSQFKDGEVTRGRKWEGAWWGDGGAYVVTSFARTSDGSVAEHDGQVWFFDPKRETMTLKVRFGRSADVNKPGDGPDNIAVSPWGGLILAEDGEGKNHIIGVTEDGETYPIARNEVDDDEFTGPCFSHNKQIMFANQQSPGVMYAITGPWKNKPRS